MIGFVRLRYRRDVVTHQAGIINHAFIDHEIDRAFRVIVERRSPASFPCHL